MELVQICHLPWDSEFFGWKIAKNMQVQLKPGDVDTLLLECTQAAVQCLYCEVDPQEHATIERLQAVGARLVEYRVVMHRLLNDYMPDQPHGVADGLTIDDCVGDADLPGLNTICRDLARWSRFAADSHFGEAGSERLYAQWLRHSLAGGADQIFVARQQNCVAGFASLKFAGEQTQIILLGVDPAQRGQGIGGRLMNVAMEWAASRAPELELVTQARNVAALRLYGRSGMLVKRVSCYFHLWFE